MHFIILFTHLKENSEKPYYFLTEAFEVYLQNQTSALFYRGHNLIVFELHFLKLFNINFLIFNLMSGENLFNFFNFNYNSKI